jgi:hypothetical protein
MVDNTTPLIITISGLDTRMRWIRDCDDAVNLVSSAMSCVMQIHCYAKRHARVLKCQNSRIHYIAIQIAASHKSIVFFYTIEDAFYLLATSFVYSFQTINP